MNKNTFALAERTVGLSLRRTALLSAAAAAVILATGCASVGSSTTKVVTDTNTQANQLSQLNKTADQVSQQLSRLLAIDHGGPVVATARATLATPLTIQWDDSGERLAEKIATTLGYRFRRSGTAPMNPVVVPIKVQDMPAAEILRQVGTRMAQVAELRVSEKQRTIEVAYRKP